MPGAFPADDRLGNDNPQPEPVPGMVHILPHGLGRGFGAFRVGFAGRGMNRGGAARGRGI